MELLETEWLRTARTRACLEESGVGGAPTTGVVCRAGGKERAPLGRSRPRFVGDWLPAGRELKLSGIERAISDSVLRSSGRVDRGQWNFDNFASGVLLQ
jgi:hypothetical protein